MIETIPVSLTIVNKYNKHTYVTIEQLIINITKCDIKLNDVVFYKKTDNSFFMRLRCIDSMHIIDFVYTIRNDNRKYFNKYDSLELCDNVVSYLNKKVRLYKIEKLLDI